MSKKTWGKIGKAIQWFFEDVVGDAGFIKAILDFSKRNKLGRAGAFNLIVDCIAASVILIVVLAILFLQTDVDVNSAINKLFLLFCLCMCFVVLDRGAKWITKIMKIRNR